MKRSTFALIFALFLLLSACSSTSDNKTKDTESSSQPSNSGNGNGEDNIADDIVGTFKKASGECGDNITWEYKNGVLTITGAGEMNNYGKVITSPFNIETYKGPWRYQDGTPFLLDIETIIIEDGITCVGGHIFSNCKNIKNVSLPETLTTICDWAFKDCEGLEEITLPSSITTIESTPFIGCDNLKTITFLNGEIEGLDNIFFAGGWGGNVDDEDITINYTGYGFEKWIESKDDYNWVLIEG